MTETMIVALAVLGWLALALLWQVPGLMDTSKPRSAGR